MPHPYGHRARLGVIVPPTNTANEAEWARMAPDGVTIHASRMPLHADTSSEAGKRVHYADLEKAARDLAQARVSVIAYGCTAGSLVNPVTQIAECMTGWTGTPAVTTAQALVEALRALGARRIAVATPYHDALNEHERHFLGEQGFDVLHIAGLGIGAGGAHEYSRIIEVPLEKVYAHALACNRPAADALLISCTDLPTLPLISRLEAQLGKPVVTSNQATLWAALRRAGVADEVQHAGMLFARH